MSTRTRREKRRAKRDEESEKGASFTAFFAKADCGCCEVGPMMFRSEASIMKVFERIGLKNSATIKDDAGVAHDGIDTFYGFWKR